MARKPQALLARRISTMEDFDLRIMATASLCHSPWTGLSDAWLCAEEQTALRQAVSRLGAKWSPVGWVPANPSGTATMVAKALGNPVWTESLWTWLMPRVEEAGAEGPLSLASGALAAARLSRWEQAGHWISRAFSRHPLAADVGLRRGLARELWPAAGPRPPVEAARLALACAEARLDADDPEGALEMLPDWPEESLPRSLHSRWSLARRRLLRVQGRAEDALEKWIRAGSPCGEWAEYREAVSLLYACERPKPALGLPAPPLETECDQVEFCYAANVLGLCELALGREMEAREQFGRALNGFMAVQCDHGERKAVNNMALLEYKAARYPQAETLMRRGWQSGRTGGDARSQRVFLENLAVLATIQGRYDEACTLYSDALALAGGDFPRDEIELRLIHIECECGDFESARRRLTELGRRTGERNTFAAATGWIASLAVIRSGQPLHEPDTGRGPPLDRLPADLAALRDWVGLEVAWHQRDASRFRQHLQDRRTRLEGRELAHDRLQSLWLASRQECLRGRAGKALPLLDQLLSHPALDHLLPLRLNVRLDKWRLLLERNRRAEAALEAERARRDLAILVARAPDPWRQALRGHPRFTGLHRPEEMSGRPQWMDRMYGLHAELSMGADPAVMLGRVVQCAVEWCSAASGKLVLLEGAEGTAETLVEWPLMPARDPGGREGGEVRSLGLSAQGQVHARLLLQWTGPVTRSEMELEEVGNWLRPWGILLHLQRTDRQLAETRKALAALEMGIEGERKSGRRNAERADHLAEAERRDQERHHPASNPVAASAAMQKVVGLARRLADSDLCVHIEGESGTGKELVVRMLHFSGRRSQGPFLTLNAATLPDHLAESELFGHRRGAFTGADRDRPGAFELADGGSLFLDEVDMLSPALQAKLLRAVQEKTFRPLGGTSDLTTSARIISASNRDIHQLSSNGRFRKDLYYRLTQIRIGLPPLRERPEDIPPLIEHFVARHGGGRKPKWSREAMQAMLSFKWPGNIRQLENEVQRLLIMDPVRVELADLSLELQGIEPGTVVRHPAANGELSHRMRRVERASIEEALRLSEGRQADAARRLGISRQRLYSAMRRLGIKPENPDHP